MTIYDLSITPTRVAMSLQTNTGAFPSPLSPGIQTITRSASRWVATYTFSNMRGDDRAELLALIAKLRGQEHRVRLPVWDNPKRGVYGGSPLVWGAGQSGGSINIDSAALSVTDYIKAGDYFSIIVNGEPELKMAVADGDTNGSGQISGLTFEPRLRAVPADNAAIHVEDGVLPTPAGIFFLSEAETGWQSRPGASSKISDIVLQFNEDTFATQP